MLRCSEGDLAWITGEPSNNGKLVEIGPEALPQTHDGKHGPCWHVMSLSGPMIATNFGGAPVMANSGVIPDAWLTPHRATGRDAEQPEPLVLNLRNAPTIGIR
jgi:hypothetical protein